VSFGGPAAHIGYFRKTFVDDLKWLDDKAYAGFVAMSQFLPGPGSSQVGFAVGYHRAGLAGGLAAFIGFTLPSFLLMWFLAVASNQWLENAYFQGAIHGLKLLAVVVVADAVWTMFNQFCKDKVTRLMMVLSAVVMMLVPLMLMQFGLLLSAAVIGIWLLRVKQTDSNNKNESASDNYHFLQSVNLRWLGVFTVALIACVAYLMWPQQSGLAQIFAQFFQVGSFVFGGGHVVLPLLEASVSESMNSDRFITGYALAQAMPGPMFSFASFLGADLFSQNAFLGALMATLAIFLPGFLLMLIFLKDWQRLSQRPAVAAAVCGINACVVGFLLAALYQPIFTSSVFNVQDMALVITGFALLKVFKPSIVMLVLGFVLAGVGLGLV
jgi:chromate transporter